MARILLITGGLLVLLSILFPVWGMTMIAPQYPDGLIVHVYPGRLEGDLSIINVLNHYVGMQPLEMDMFALLTALPYVLAVLGGGLIVSGIIARRGVALLMVFIMGLSGLFGVVELRRNLVDFGTNLDPAAPLDMEPFVPPIIGKYEVWNFDIYHTFMAGAYLLLVAAVMAFIGYRRLNRSAGSGRPDRGKGRLRTRSMASAVSKFFSSQSSMMLSVLIAAAMSFVSMPTGDGVEAASVGRIEMTRRPLEIVVTSGYAPDLIDALASVADGGTVTVDGGVYRGPFVVERGVHLVAKRDAEIVGGGDGDVIAVKDGAKVTGFTVRHLGGVIRSDDAAIRLFDTGSTVANNTIVVDTAHGIYIERGGGHTVWDNIISGLPNRTVDDRGNGLFLFDTKENRISGNDIRYVRDGIYLSFAGQDVISDNEISLSRYGIHSMFSSDIVYEKNRLHKNVIGSAFMYSGNMDIVNNFIVDHSGHRGYGILLKDGNRNRLRQNYVVGNHLGLFADLSDENDIVENIFAVNGMAMEIFSSSERNRIIANAFLGNGADTLLNAGRHTTIWSDEVRGGNYWDTYRGVDVDGKGFGAIPHTSGDAFGFIVQRNPELRAFYLSPAIDALEWAERAFPLLGTPKVRDDRPLVRTDQEAVAAMHDLIDRYVLKREDGRSGALLGAMILMVVGVVFGTMGPLLPLTGRMYGARANVPYV